MTWIKPVAFLILITFLARQTQAQKEFFFTGYIGFNASQVSGDDLSGFNKLGPYGGIATGQEINDKWHWELGMVFTSKGSYSNGGANTNFKYVLGVNYIEVPVAFRYFFKLVHLEFGPSFGTRIGFRENNFNGPVNDPRKMGRFELGGFVGAMYEVNDRFSVLARFSNSLIPVREHRSGATFLYNRGQYHTVITAALRVNF